MAVEPLPQLPHGDAILDATDAKLVDVIHTDTNFAGTMVRMGDVDFYVGRNENSLGSSQAGCGCTDNCDHATAFHLFAESVEGRAGVTRLLRCQGINSLNLQGCKEENLGENPIGYFYNLERGLDGIIGVVTESDAVEIPCLNEDDWVEDDWEEDDWGSEDGWNETEDPKENVKDDNDIVPQGKAENKDVNLDTLPHDVAMDLLNIPILSSNVISTSSEKPSIEFDNNQKTEGKQQPESLQSFPTWKWYSKTHDCNSTCISLISSSVCFSLFCLLLCLYTCVRRGITVQQPFKAILSKLDLVIISDNLK